MIQQHHFMCCNLSNTMDSNSKIFGPQNRTKIHLTEPITVIWAKLGGIFLTEP